MIADPLRSWFYKYLALAQKAKGDMGQRKQYQESFQEKSLPLPLESLRLIVGWVWNVYLGMKMH